MFRLLQCDSQDIFNFTYFSITTTISMPALNPLPVLRNCAFRPRQSLLRPSNAVIGVKRPAHRSFADKKSDLPTADKDAVGPNMQQAEHVSEEAAKMAKIQGGEGPDMSQGTPVQDVSDAEVEE